MVYPTEVTLNNCFILFFYYRTNKPNLSSMSLRIIRSNRWDISNRSHFSPFLNPNDLTSPINPFSKPKPSPLGTPYPTTYLHFYINFSSTIIASRLLRSRINYVLYYIWNHTNSYPIYHYPLRKPGRTIKCRTILFILYISQFNTPFNCSSIYASIFRNLIYPYSSSHPWNSRDHMSIQVSMTSLFISFLSEDASIWSSSMTSQSTCRSTYRRFNDSGRRSSETWRIRNITSANLSRPCN